MDQVSKRLQRHGLLIATAVIATVLAVLFYKSFLPGWVLFANDASMGLLSADSVQLPGAISGLWLDLQWVGIQYPSAGLNITQLVGSLAPSGAVLAKFNVPFALLFLGVGGTVMARKLGCSLGVAVAVGLAAALNSNPFSYACWGLPGKAMALGSALFALACLFTRAAGWRRWLLVALAGFATGLTVMEGGDVGAILSLYVGLFAIWQAFESKADFGRSVITRGSQILLLVVCAGWIAIHTVYSLVSTSIIGVSGMEQQQEAAEKRWDFATSMSFPISETVRIAIPGIYGYRMDTPAGGAYWGNVGFDGAVEHRFNGGGEYAGILVLVVAFLAVAASLRNKGGILSETERRGIWFWTTLCLVSLLFAYGRNAPFYRIIFSLPYFSTIRIPLKFLHGMHLCLWILFAYGLEYCARAYVRRKLQVPQSFLAAINSWKLTRDPDDRFTARVLWTVAAIGIACAILYNLRYQEITKYLASVPFDSVQPATAWFSIREVWITVAFLVGSAAILNLTIGGYFRGGKSTGFSLAIAAIVVADLGRSNLHWIKYFNYRERYERNAIVEVLREKPWEHRVSAYLSPNRADLLVPTMEFAYLQKEWLENHFPYNNIQSLDIDQMPRMPELEGAYLSVFHGRDRPVAANLAGHVSQLAKLPADQLREFQAVLPRAQSNLFLVTRLWELTNTRYLLGWADGIDEFNTLFDPVQRRFKVKLRYALALKPGLVAPAPSTALADAIQSYTAVKSENGPLALIEFSGALPRAKFYSMWETATDDRMVLDRIQSTDFNPTTSVVIPNVPPPAQASDGKDEVSFETYTAKHLVLKCKSGVPGILLLNDRWHPDWSVRVDGKQGKVLRANFLMRAVQLEAGNHIVEFNYHPDTRPMYASIGALIVAAIFSIVLLTSTESVKPSVVTK